MIISICNDVSGLLSRHPELLIEGDDKRSKLIAWSGAHTHYNGNKSIKVLTSIEGLEDIAADESVTLTTYEEIFGYNTFTVIDGETVIDETILPDVDIRALYESVWPTTPQMVDGETHTNTLIFSLPAGYSTSHLTLEA